MKDWRSLAHTKWDCKYHIVLVPKYRREVFFGKFRQQVGEILRTLCVYLGIELLEGHAMPDHIHMLVAIPPKYSVSYTVGYLKGKSAIRIHKELFGWSPTWIYQLELLDTRLFCQHRWI